MRWIGFLVIVFQVSCTIDELPSCEGLGEEGEICKEYQYIFGRYNGVNEYEYDINTGFLSQITTKRKNGSIEGVAQYSYNDLGFVSSIVFQDSKGQLLKEKSIYYNDLGDIDTEITIGESKVEYKYHYDGYVLNSSVLSINGEVEWVDSIEYFSGLVIKIISLMPISIASSTAYWTKGLSIIGSISFGIAFEAGKNLVPKPATGKIALVINSYSL